jgi:hypothetical protein
VATTTMAIAALIPDPFGRRMNRLRRRIGPYGDDGMPPHIPLVAPFRVQPSFLPLEQHCWQVCHDSVPFEVELGSLLMDEDEGLAYYSVASGGDRLAALRDALLAGKYAPPRDEGHYQPRAVVARVGYPDEFAVAQREENTAGASVSLSLERIELMAQYPDGTWYERDFYTLDRAIASA